MENKFIFKLGDTVCYFPEFLTQEKTKYIVVSNEPYFGGTKYVLFTYVFNFLQKGFNKSEEIYQKYSKEKYLLTAVNSSYIIGCRQVLIEKTILQLQNL